MDFKTLLQLIMISVLATSAMTAFSYALSEGFRKLYKEPVLLTFLLKQLKLDLSGSAKNVLAWLLHYAIGLMFVIGYHLLWSFKILDVTVQSVLILGIISGFIGILGWIIMFKIAKYVPQIDFKGYYLQLFFAHIIFAGTATAFYYLLKIGNNV